MEEEINANLEELSDKKYKMSVVMPVYNTNIKLLNGSVESLLTQTLKEIEIVIVNDCSTNKNIKPALAELSQKDSRIKIINLENNVGSFAARLIAMKETKGEYIGFLDSDDKISPNCLREMYNKAIEANAEIVATSFCKDDPVLKIYFNTLDPYRIKNYDLYGEDIIKEYFLQHGEFYAWQIMCNKIYSQKLIRDIIPHLDDFVKNYPRLIMGDDVAFNFVAYTYANHFVSISGEGIYYLTHEGQSTNQVASKSKYLRNVNDISNVFLFMKNFLTKFELYDKYIKDISIWKNNFADYYYCCGKECLNEEEALNLIREKMELPNYVYKVDESVNSGYFYDSLTENTGNEHGKNAIIYGISDPKTKFVMFDIFSVLTTTELFDNKDIFRLVNKSECAKNIDFYDIRINAEKALEKENNLTLDKIYSYIQEKYNLSAEICLKLKEEEKKLVVKYSKIRDYGLKLYELAKDFDKKIIVTTRNCYDEGTIKEILNKMVMNLTKFIYQIILIYQKKMAVFINIS